jgi:transposase-like protein
MFMAKRTKFTWEDRKRIIQRLLPPENISVKELAKEIGVSDVTIYDWRTKINNGYLDKKSSSDKKYSAEDKFHIVLETYSLSEGELNAYCRKKGLYPATVKKWQQNAIKGTEGPKSTVNTTEMRNELKKVKEDSKKLKSELNRKDKALAETAALLVLRKKANAIWGDPEEK